MGYPARFASCCATGSPPKCEVYDVEVDHVFPGHRPEDHAAECSARDRMSRTRPRVILLAIEDVTERRLTERRLAAQRRELERSNAALNEFAFVASHDLQEPLRKILSFGERLETSAGPALEGNARHYLDRMLDAAGRMRTLITDLLAYSQMATSAAAIRADRPGDDRARGRRRPRDGRSPTRAAEWTWARCR